LRALNEFSGNEEIAFTGHLWALKGWRNGVGGDAEARMCRGGKAHLGKHW
jgi:hypothetical protein